MHERWHVLPPFESVQRCCTELFHAFPLDYFERKYHLQKAGRPDDTAVGAIATAAATADVVAVVAAAAATTAAGGYCYQYECD